MARALEGSLIEGLGHNTPFLSAVMDAERFRSGALSTSYIKDEFPDGFHGLAPDAFQRDAMTAAAAWAHRLGAARARAAGDARLAREDWIVVLGDLRRAVRLSQAGEGALRVTFADEDRAVVLDGVDWRPGPGAVFRAARRAGVHRHAAPRRRGVGRCATAPPAPACWCWTPPLGRAARQAAAQGRGLDGQADRLAHAGGLWSPSMSRPGRRSRRASRWR